MTTTRPAATTAADGTTTLDTGTGWTAVITPANRFGFRSAQLHHNGRPVGDPTASSADRIIDDTTRQLTARAARA